METQQTPERGSRDPQPGPEAESGAWGAVALTLLALLFVLAAGATVHSFFATF